MACSVDAPSLKDLPKVATDLKSQLEAFNPSCLRDVDTNEKIVLPSAEGNPMLISIYCNLHRFCIKVHFIWFQWKLATIFAVFNLNILCIDNENDFFSEIDYITYIDFLFKVIEKRTKMRRAICRYTYYECIHIRYMYT